MPDAQAPFDAFQPYYELMVDWEHRLAFEAPFFQRVFSSRKSAAGARLRLRHGPPCPPVRAVGPGGRRERCFRGDGRGGAAPRRRRARGRAVRAGRFPHAGRPFRRTVRRSSLHGQQPAPGRLAGGFAPGRPKHARVLSPGGVAVIHTLNYACFPEGRSVYEDPRVRLVEDRELVFLKAVRRARQHCDLDIVVLEKQAGEWKKIEARARAWALEQPELKKIATEAGFVRLQWYGGFDPKPFDADTSRDLILVARRRKGGE